MLHIAVHCALTPCSDLAARPNVKFLKAALITLRCMPCACTSGILQACVKKGKNRKCIRRPGGNALYSRRRCTPSKACGSRGEKCTSARSPKGPKESEWCGRVGVPGPWPSPRSARVPAQPHAGTPLSVSQAMLGAPQKQVHPRMIVKAHLVLHRLSPQSAP